MGLMIKRMSILAALGFCLSLLPVVVGAEEQIQAPVFNEGDFWQFKIISQRPSNISSSESLPNGLYNLRYADGLTVRELVDGKEMPAKRSRIVLNWLSFDQDRRSELTPFPLYVGKQWRYSKKRKRSTEVFNVEAVTKESVTTQAGNFSALKIETTSQRSIANPRAGSLIISTRITYFYSPETKSIIKYESESEDGSALHIELLKFESSH